MDNFTLVLQSADVGALFFPPSLIISAAEYPYIVWKIFFLKTTLIFLFNIALLTDVQCPEPKIEKGYLSGGSRPPHGYQATVTIVCNQGYKLNGHTNVVCGINSTWTPELPKCEGTSNKSSYLFWSVKVKKLVMLNHSQNMIHYQTWRDQSLV